MAVLVLGISVAGRAPSQLEVAPCDAAGWEHADTLKSCMPLAPALLSWLCWSVGEPPDLEAWMSLVVGGTEPSRVRGELSSGGRGGLCKK